MAEEVDYEPAKLLRASESSSCLVCYDDLSSENMVAYKTKIDSDWYLSTFCIDCISHLLKSQYHKYIDTLATTTCAREQRTLLDRGPPINISDRIGFPESGSDEVYCMFDFKTDQPLSAKLDGSVTGEDRQKLWDELNRFRFKNDTEE